MESGSKCNGNHPVLCLWNGTLLWLKINDFITAWLSNAYVHSYYNENAKVWSGENIII